MTVFETTGVKDATLNIFALMRFLQWNVASRLVSLFMDIVQEGLDAGTGVGTHSV